VWQWNSLGYGAAFTDHVGAYFGLAGYRSVTTLPRGDYYCQYMKLPSQHANNGQWFNLGSPLLAVNLECFFSVASKGRID